jgi:hypothetical protein
MIIAVEQHTFLAAVRNTLQASHVGTVSRVYIRRMFLSAPPRGVLVLTEPIQINIFPLLPSLQLLETKTGVLLEEKRAYSMSDYQNMSIKNRCIIRMNNYVE